MNSPACSADSLWLAATRNAAGCARLYIRNLLRRWRIDHIAHLAELMATELVLVGTRVPVCSASELHYDALADVGWVRLRVELRSDLLLIETWDADPAPPWITRPGEENSTSGLYFVPMLARRWDYSTPPTGGRILRCELTIPPTDRQPLPRRKPTATGHRPSAPVGLDLVLLRRVRDRLADYEPLNLTEGNS